MAISYVDSVTYNNAQSTTILTVDYPVNLGTPLAPRVGQLMILAISFSAAGTSNTTVSGWTTINRGSVTSGLGTHLYYKLGDGSAGTATIVFDSSCRVTAAIQLFDGTATSSPVDVSNVTANGSAFTASSASLTTTAANDMLFGAWGSGVLFGEAGGMAAILQSPSGVAGKGLTTNWEILGAAGSTGVRTASSFNVTDGQPGTSGGANVAMVAIKAFNGPSIPVITAPIDGEYITLGRTYSITWTAATDPVIAQSALTYNIDYSLNDGTSWTQITAATSAGAITYAWNTTGLTATSQAKLRIRAYNGTDYSVDYDTTGRFSLLTDAAPLAPTNMRGEQPDGITVTLFDLALTLLVKGTFNDPGDVMTAFQLDWGTDGITYANTSTNTTSTLSKSYAGATFTAGTVYFRCRTADNAGTYGAYAYFQLTAAAAPATPNITAPTNASPPTSATPTHTWTSSGQAKYRLRIVQAGTVVYNGDYISSTALSVPAPYSYRNSTTYTLYLSVEASNGLRSAEDSETFTASYTGPTTPTLTATAIDASGYIELIIGNPDSPEYNDIWRYLSGETTDDAIKIASTLPINAVFQDYSAISGQGYIYFAQAVNSLGGFTNSVVSSTTTLTLSLLWLHVVQEAVGTSSNAVAGEIVSLSNMAPGEVTQEIMSDRKKARGRTKPVTILGQSESKKLRYNVILTDGDVAIGKQDALNAIFEANETICARDQRGNRVFGRIIQLPLVHSHTYSGVALEVIQTDFTEGL